MHAIVCHEHGGPDVMQWQEVPEPSPGAGELLVKPEAIGVNYVDTMRRSGRHPTAPPPPFTPGIELCGRVVSVAADVTDFQPGDRVIGRLVSHGAYAELVIVERRFAVACPDKLPAETAAALFVNGQTAYHALLTVGHVQPDENVLVTAAAGGVGTCAIQIAKLSGARVIAVAGTVEKLQLATELGADVAIDYSQDTWPGQVLDATGGRGADLILESVGGTVAQGCVECWAPGGRIVVFGKASGQAAVITGDHLLFGNRTAYGLACGIVLEDEELMRRAMDDLLKWVQDGRLQTVLGKTFPLNDAAEAHRQLEGRQTHGKVVLLP